MEPQRKSTQIAVGGVFSGLCLVIMFLTAMVPFGTYALPAIAGAMLVVVVVENGNKVALMVYVSVSLLSLLIVPDQEAKMLFVFLFGYYPVAKGKIEGLKSLIVQYLVKLGLFLAAVVLAYQLMVLFMGIDLVAEMGDLGKYGAYIMLGMGGAVFLLYDMTLTRYTQLYICHFRQKLGRP